MLILLLDLLAAVLGVLHLHLCIRYFPVPAQILFVDRADNCYTSLYFFPLFLFLFNLEFENLLLSVPSVLSCSFLLSSILLFSTLLPRGMDRVEHNRIYKQLSFSFSMGRHKADSSFSRNPNFPEIYLINYELFKYKAFISKIESLTLVFRFRFRFLI